VVICEAPPMTCEKRRWLYGAAIMALAALAMGGCGTTRDATSARQPSPSDVEGRILRERSHLAREGIYVEQTAVGKSCAEVQLANPTAPNIAYMRDRFGTGVCVSGTPSSALQACAGHVTNPVPEGSVIVPNLVGLNLYEAEKRVTSLGLTFALRCLGDRRTHAARPGRFSPEALVFITAQCPRPGQAVTAGSEVALDGRAPLPGGFEYPVGTLDFYHTESHHPCGDGRNP
jgi:PASTA domain